MGELDRGKGAAAARARDDLMPTSYVDVRIERRELDRQAARLLQIEGLERIELAPPQAITGNPGEVELTFVNLTGPIAGESALIMRIEQGAGVKVLASRTRSMHWRRPRR